MAQARCGDEPLNACKSPRANEQRAAQQKLPSGLKKGCNSLGREQQLNLLPEGFLDV